MKTTFFLTLAMPLLLTACGLRGPLYMPTRPAAATPAPAATSAPAPASTPAPASNSK